jgi:uncharacterized protein DUF6335
MAKRKTARRAPSVRSAGKKSRSARSGKRPTTKRPAKRTASRKKAVRSVRAASPRKAAKAPVSKTPRLNRPRRTLTDDPSIPTPPSSLNMNRHGSAARSGRKEMENNLQKHGGMSPALTGGDVDADWENAYFSGDEAPGGDNLTPDQEVVDDIGKALGVQYEDNEELKAADKVVERDKHRWELDPASAEDYKERK